MNSPPQPTRRSPNPLKGDLGQTQLLGVMLLSTALLTIGIFSLDRANRGQVQSIKQSRVQESRAALETAALRAKTIFQSEAACDPVLLQSKINFLQPDGTIQEGTPSQRVLHVEINGRNYPVRFGSITTIPWISAETDPSIDPITRSPILRGTPQDAELEIWTTSSNPKPFKATLKVALINTCFMRCEKKLPEDGQAQSGEVCSDSSNPSIHMHPRVPNLDPIPHAGLPAFTSPRAAVWKLRTPCVDTSGPTGSRYLGDLPLSSTLDNGTAIIQALELSALKQAIQTGNFNWLATPNSLTPSVDFPSCGDLNLDGQVNSIDIHLFEKWLRGYIYRVPVGPAW